MALVIPKDLSEEALRSFQAGDFTLAANLFDEAASAFLASGNELDAAEMKNNKSVALLQAGDAAGAFESAQNTADIFYRNGDYRRQGMAHANEASALEALGRIQEALQAYQLAAEALEHAGEDQLRANVLQQMAGLQLRQGKYFEALYSMRVGLAGLRKPTLKQKILRVILKLPL